MTLRDGFTLRIALIGDLFLFVIALMMFSILPIFGDTSTNPVMLEELISCLLGVPALALLFGRLFIRPAIPWNEWAYLYVAGYSVLVGATFFTFAAEIATPQVRAILIVIFSSHIVGAVGAHFIEGSNKPLKHALREVETGAERAGAGDSSS